MNIIISSNFSTLPTSSPKSEEYLNHLLQNNQLPAFLENKNYVELNSLISLILKQFEYEIYKNSIIFKTNFTKEKTFQLTIDELKVILLEKDETEQNKLIRFFISSKSNYFIPKQKINNIQKEKYNYNEQCGLFNSKNELQYGLWRNSLFLKMNKSNLSHLFDRRVLNATQISDNPRVILDFNYVENMRYFSFRSFGNQLNRIFSFNKYKTCFPFTIELIQMKKTKHFDDLMTNFVSTHWGIKRHFNLERHYGKTVAQLAPNPKSVIYICPVASKILKVDEVLNPNNLFVLPAYSSLNLRDPLLSTICLNMKQLNVKVRRLPTQEHLVWKHFCGVLGIDDIFAILHDIRYDTKFEWETVFRKHLSNKILSVEEIESKQRRNNKHILPPNFKNFDLISKTGKNMKFTEISKLL